MMATALVSNLALYTVLLLVLVLLVRNEKSVFGCAQNRNRQSWHIVKAAK